MRVPVSWLSEFLNVESTKEIASILTEIGLEVAEIESVNDEEVLCIELTINRGDCQSILGVARELSAALGKRVHLPPLQFSESPEKVSFSLQVEEPALCARYIGRLLKDVNVAPSPCWLKERLNAYGISPVNNVVDITNYVLIEWGQPLHAFDLERIEGGEIFVRKAMEGEEIVLLDGVCRKIPKDTLVIADKKGPIAIAGIMGGERACVRESTKCVLLECACFPPDSIKRSAESMGIKTESSTRFERGVDIEALPLAVSRALHLLQKLCDATVCKEGVEYRVPIFEQKYISFAPERINRILGASIPEEEIKDILERLHFSIEEERVKVPTFRQDITKEEDLAEEVARIYGYGRIPESLPQTLAIMKRGKEEKVLEKVRNALVAWGFEEVVTYSLITEEDLALSLIDGKNVVRIKNPLGKESVLTPSLLPNFLKTIELNRRRGAKDIKIFEVARTFKKEEDGIKERKVLAAALTGKDTFHTLSSVSKGLLNSLGIKHTLSRTSHPSFHPGKCALMKHGKELLGILGEVHPDVKRSYGVENVCMFEIDWNKLIYLSNFEKFYKTLPKFPAIRRDVSILVREEDEARRYEKIMRENGGELLEQIKLFDVYKGDQIPSGYRSLSYTLIYRREDRTLKDEEVERVHKRVLAELERAGAKIR